MGEITACWNDDGNGSVEKGRIQGGHCPGIRDGI